MNFDNCKKCGSSALECRFCINSQFYRHIDDKEKMKKNLKIIRNQRTIIFLTIWNENYKSN